jgi:hypothetical protein
MFSINPDSERVWFSKKILSAKTLNDDTTIVAEKPNSVSTITKGAFCGIKCLIFVIGFFNKVILTRIFPEQLK